MAYHDISGKLELTSTSNQKEIVERLFASFRSLEIDSEIDWNDEISFKIPLLKTLRRGNIFQGISSGLIKVERSEDGNALRLEYKLITLPMRLGIIIMLLWILIGMPAILFIQNEGFNLQGYFSFQFTAVMFFGFAFLIGRLFSKNNFVTFIRKSLSGKAEIVQQPLFGRKNNIKKIAIFSCSGILFLALLIPAIIAVGILNLQSKVVWRSPIQNAVMSAPVISDGVVYFGSLNDVDVAAFYALDSTSGEQLWKKALGGSVNYSPVLTDGSVCFGVDDGFFYCLDRKNGRELWKLNPRQRNLDAATCDHCALKFNAPVIDNNVIYVGSHDHNMYALDAQTGRINWRFTTGGAIMDAPAIVGGTIYVGSYDGYIYLLVSKTGKEVRRYLVPNSAPMDTAQYSGVYATPLIDASTIYAVNGSLTALDIHNGEIKWQVFGSSAYEDQIIGSPFFFEDLIIVTTTDAIYAIDKASGKNHWKYSNIKGGVFFTPTLHEEVIYFGDSSGYLYGIKAATGRRVFRYNMNHLDFSSYDNWIAEFAFPPGVDEQKIYVKWFSDLYAIKK
jgi:eukaryotic-like serine/threonine-protein kinase